MDNSSLRKTPNSSDIAPFIGAAGWGVMKDVDAGWKKFLKKRESTSRQAKYLKGRVNCFMEFRAEEIRDVEESLDRTNGNVLIKNRRTYKIKQ